LVDLLSRGEHFESQNPTSAKAHTATRSASTHTLSLPSHSTHAKHTLNPHPPTPPKQVTDSNGRIILFIDEIHTVVGAGATSGAMDAGNLLKPMLGRGELRCIGATTVRCCRCLLGGRGLAVMHAIWVCTPQPPTNQLNQPTLPTKQLTTPTDPPHPTPPIQPQLDEYRTYIEKDPALERRFQQVYVDQPSVAQTVSILRGLRERYEVHHGVRISDNALVEAAVLSDRYISDR
jgi:hypothetical protein